MTEAGMDVARLNFSHGTYDNHALLIRNIRTAASNKERPVAILQDLQGPRIRLGELPEEGVVLKAGSRATLSTAINKMLLSKLPVTYGELHQDVKSGQRILIDDGLIELKILDVQGEEIHCKVIIGGTVISHKGMNLPDSEISIPALTRKDVEDLQFGIDQRVDLVALSFVKSASDVKHLRQLLKKYQPKKETAVQIVVKIEKHEAVKNFDGILEAADGVMIARGDLGIEMPAEEVPLIQKGLIKKCLEASKPVIVATQMLDSMVRNSRPTRAEVSDVANAVIDHTDAIMLSAESATGKYPVKAVKYMDDIAARTEASAYNDLDLENLINLQAKQNELTYRLALALQGQPKISAAIVATKSGRSARLLSRLRPEIPIWAFTNDSAVAHQLNLSFGVFPLQVKRKLDPNNLATHATDVVKKMKLIKKGQYVLVMAGSGQKVSRDEDIDVTVFHVK